MTMKKTYILVGIVLLAITIVALFFGLKQNQNRNIPDSSGSRPQKESTIITLPIGARGDEVDPGPIEDECQRRMRQYIKSSEFNSKGFSKCDVIESKVGLGDEECPNGFSPQGCSICRLKCE